MISKRKMKLIRSLELRKKRREEGLFVGEGPKLVGDLLGIFPCIYLAATEEWWAQNEPFGTSLLIDEKEVCSFDELQKGSFLMHPVQSPVKEQAAFAVKNVRQEWLICFVPVPSDTLKGGSIVLPAREGQFDVLILVLSRAT